MARLDEKFGCWDRVVGIGIRYVLERSAFEHLSRDVQMFPAPPNVLESHSSFKIGTWSLPQGY
jgi:hypothetical protein